MNIRAALTSLILLLSSPLVAQADSAPYRLSSGDVINISVYGEKDLSIDKLELNDSGTFSYPFIGEVLARGKTTAEVEKDVTARLSQGYLVSPRVSVSVANYRPFFIGGEVKTPNGYAFKPGLTVDGAIALAGGMTERGSSKRITIIHGADNARTAEKATLNTPVSAGDTITVDQGFF
jgi:polysaccharide export outer membrane protein